MVLTLAMIMECTIRGCRAFCLILLQLRQACSRRPCPSPRSQHPRISPQAAGREPALRRCNSRPPSPVFCKGIGRQRLLFGLLLHEPAQKVGGRVILLSGSFAHSARERVFRCSNHLGSYEIFALRKVSPINTTYR